MSNVILLITQWTGIVLIDIRVSAVYHGSAPTSSEKKGGITGASVLSVAPLASIRGFFITCRGGGKDAC